MTTYNWTIVSMPAYPQADNETDVVFQVNWRCAAQDSSYNAVSFGSVSVAYTESTPFTPYDQLTESQVWGWVNPQIDRAEIELNLQALIDEQKNPPVATLPLPWVA